MGRTLKVSLIVGIIMMFLSTTCIPAIQLDISNSANQQSSSHLKTEEQTQKTKYILELPEQHPLLYLVVWSILIFRELRSLFLFEIATDPDPMPPGFEVVFPTLFVIWFILSIRIMMFSHFWRDVSNYFGWDWIE